MEALTKDPEINIVKMKSTKMRFSEHYDAHLSAGYRDVQISICINTEWTCRMGLDRMILEVQLHDKAFYDKKMHGGHEGYTQRRNQLGQ